MALLVACENAPDAPGAQRSGSGIATAGAVPSPSLRPPTQTASQDDRYESCVKAARFDPGGVQVLVSVAGEVRPDNDPTMPTGTPVWVKTGRDVPAAIHRPCLQAVGGKKTQTSSYGNP
jgi:hypothetical protein